MSTEIEQIFELKQLRPKARILKTLGEELISSETVALIEMVKNSYDADAETVLIKFNDLKSESGSSIEVYDDGHGMDINVIYDSWMVISGTTKKNNKNSKRKSRRVLGEKGIGRFATSRLANELELITRVTKDDREIYALFDWTQFDNDELYLDEILFLAESRKAETITHGWPLEEYQENNSKEKRNHTGTALKLNQLKHKWERKDLENLKRGLSRLMSPFELKDDFKIYLELPAPFQDFSAQITAPDIIKYPHYKIFGTVTSDGHFDYTVSIEASGNSEPFKGFFVAKKTSLDWDVVHSERSAKELIGEDENESGKTSSSIREISCGPLNFEILVWDRDDLENVNQKIGGGIRSVRRDLDAVAGVNIYRDGFRVLPYGEPDNDWLRLDIRRVQNPSKRLSNNQITGYIGITADDNPGLHDRSNREGLDNNQAYDDLRDVMKAILTDLEELRRIERKPKKEKPTSDKPNQESLFSSPDFDTLRDTLKNQSVPKETIELINTVENEWKRKVLQFKSVLSQYHSLATLGSIVDKVLHDGRQPLSTIQTEAGLGKEITQEYLPAESDSIQVTKKDIFEINTGFSRIVDQANVIRTVFKRIEPFGGRKKGRPKKYYIEEIVNDTFALFERDIKDCNIKVDLPNTETLVSIDPDELKEIFTNLLMNSVYWLDLVPRDKRKIFVTINRLADTSLEIIFSDSGPGIESIYKNEVFEPYFSKKPDGVGLGLSIVGEIVKDYYNGSVELLDTGKTGGASFRIIIRKRV